MPRLWAAYRRYFLNHLPAHFLGFVMGCVYEAILLLPHLRGP
jgi:hypothetical protein